MINKLDLAVFFDNLNIRTPLTRHISLLATVTREITVDLHDSLLYWIPVKWFLVFWGIFICRTTTEQSSNPSSSSEQNLTGSVHDLNIISQRRAGEETLSFFTYIWFNCFSSAQIAHQPRGEQCPRLPGLPRLSTDAILSI